MKQLIVLSMLGALGCAVPPPPPEVPSSIDYEFQHRSNGEPVRYEAKDGTRTIEEKVPLREHSLYDSRGRYLGKDVEWTTRTAERNYHEWHVYQGDTEIDPLSALHIVRDKAFEAAYAEERARVEKDHALAMDLYETEVKARQSTVNLGMGLGVAGIVGMVGAGLIFFATRGDGKGETLPMPATVSGIAGLGFMGLSGGGFYMRSKATQGQSEAMLKANRLAASRFSDREFSRFEIEEHVRKAIPAKGPEAAPPSSDGAEAQSEEPSSLPMPGVRVSKAFLPLVEASIANNPKLGRALVAIWTPDASGSIPSRAHDDFERELLRSKLYLRNVDGNVSLHQGNIVAYTDTASLQAAEDKGAKATPIAAIELLSIAVVVGRGIYVHYEGDASVFTVLEPERVAKLLDKATATAK